jgi:hypothetical protein
MTTSRPAHTRALHLVRSALRVALPGRWTLNLPWAPKVGTPTVGPVGGEGSSLRVNLRVAQVTGTFSRRLRPSLRAIPPSQTTRRSVLLR